jgi:hypothetical protein
VNLVTLLASHTVTLLLHVRNSGSSRVDLASTSLAIWDKPVEHHGTLTGERNRERRGGSN